MPAELSAGRVWARDWLTTAALPLWWERGADHAAGGFHDQLDQMATPIELPKRLRVQARQVFVYAAAGRLGWDGDWRAAVGHGLDFLLAAYRRDDGLFRASVDRAGRAVVDAPDLYDQAFVLLALAAAYRALGRPQPLRDEACQLLAVLQSRLGHPHAGFEEARPRRLPLRANPHMHLLEALLAWSEAGGGASFEAPARAIVALALTRLIDPRTGAIGEYFDGQWRFAAAPDGTIREPGHQFEWAYLLGQAGRALGGDHRPAIARLQRFASVHGLRDGRAIAALDATGELVDGSSRLWAQSERLRTMLALGAAAPSDASFAAAAVESLATLRRHLDVPTRGLWRDRMTAAGALVDAPAPASSLYHIVTAMQALIGG